MNKKIRFTIVSLFVLVISFMSIQHTLAQTEWDYCKISAYGTNFDDFSTSTTNTERYEFTVVDPPSGSEITNTIEVRDDSSGENYTIDLSAGDRVHVDYYNKFPSQNSQNPASEPNHVILLYEGEVRIVTINNVDVPEFPPILIVPLFITATLLALIYNRRKNTD